LLELVDRELNVVGALEIPHRLKELLLEVGGRVKDPRATRGHWGRRINARLVRPGHAPTIAPSVRPVARTACRLGISRLDNALIIPCSETTHSRPLHRIAR
jgi:hypothetical protein